MTDTERFIDALQTTPNLRPFIEKCAKRASQGKMQPATMTLDDVDYDEQRELSSCFDDCVDRKRDGRVRISVPEYLRRPEAWAGIVTFLGLSAGKEKISNAANALQRAKLIHGDLPFIADAADTPEIVRFLDDPQNEKPWIALYGWGIQRWRKVEGTTTLSQLGSDLFNDSKSLRSGSLRRQLLLILQMLDATDIADERVLFTKFGIVDNPYTSHVTLFAPIQLKMDDGKVLDFPLRLHEMGMACQLPLETIERVSDIIWSGKSLEVHTSENAAPFAMMVKAGKSAIYTEGYPNFAVKKLLRLLKPLGVEAVHEGDADLDGFRIAEEIGRCIHLKRVVASEVLARRDPKTGIPMTDEQKARLSAFRAKGTLDSPYYEDYLRLKKLGRWFEQEAFHEA